ncbi:MAG: xanthine dehydrogenase family protein molybdopterin-binding subunit [Betaproteobacteria bacterium]|nr:xanthine dehydrogenase family protein molybdopterin-binding subunit [Betaproteobacteria bacterium]
MQETVNRFGIGRPVRRVEDARFLTGRSRFVADVDLPRQAYGALLLSPHSHAQITRIDTTKAKSVTGVIEVLTGSDAIQDKLGGFPSRFMPENIGFPKGYRTVRPVLIADRVRCVGERIAFVVAETLDQARDAVDLIEVDYDPLPVSSTLADAIKPGASKVWEDCESNISFKIWFGNEAAAEAAFASAHKVVTLETGANRITANTLEPRGAVGEYHAADDTWTLYTSSQNPHGVRNMLAEEIFKIPETSMRVITPDVGGGFGMKSTPYPDDALVLWASRRIGRPVKWVATRSEALLCDSHARDQLIKGELALDVNGKILAVRAAGYQNIGAYTVAATLVPSEISLLFIPSVYDIPNAWLTTRGVFTNTSPLTSYRGAGRPEAITLIERLMDKAALELGIDPIEMRRRNFIRPQAMPYKTATGFSYDSGEFEKLMDQGLALADWNGFGSRRAQSEAKGMLRGRALTYYIEMGGRFNDRMELRCDPGGTVTIVAGTHSHGQGHATTYAQMVSDWLGVPFDSIRYLQGDTDKVPFGRGSFAARASLVGGAALREASLSMIEKAKLMAAHLMEAAAKDIEFKNGQFRIAGTDKSMSFANVARAFYRPGGIPKHLGVGLEASGSWEADPPNYPNGCHLCELEIDPQTGEVRLDSYTVIDDLGRVINPMICEGQIHGGLAQGIGQALMEHAVYDPESGQLLSGSFTDYCMPRADDFSPVKIEYVEIPCTTNPLGVKGVGEAGAVGSPPTIVNAILDALRPLGVTHIEMPATPNRVWQAIHSASAET